MNDRLVANLEAVSVEHEAFEAGLVKERAEARAGELWELDVERNRKLREQS